MALHLDYRYCLIWVQCIENRWLCQNGIHTMDYRNHIDTQKLGDMVKISSFVFSLKDTDWQQFTCNYWMNPWAIITSSTQSSKSFRPMHYSLSRRITRLTSYTIFGGTIFTTPSVLSCSSTLLNVCILLRVCLVCFLSASLGHTFSPWSG